MCSLRTNKIDFKCFLFNKNRSSNAVPESFNAQIKLFRANLRGVADKKFFLFRIAKLYGYPH